MAWRDSDPWLDAEPWGEHEPVEPVDENGPWIGATRPTDAELLEVVQVVQPVDPPAPGEILDASLWWSDSTKIKYVPLAATVTADVQISGALDLALPLAGSVTDDIRVSQGAGSTEIPLSGGITDDIQVQPAPLFPQGTNEVLLGGSVEDDQVLSGQLSREVALGSTVQDDIETSAWIGYIRPEVSGEIVDDIQVRAALRVLGLLYGSVSDEIELSATLYVTAPLVSGTISDDFEIAPTTLHLATPASGVVEDDIQMSAQMRLALPLSSGVVDDYQVEPAPLGLAGPLLASEIVDDTLIESAEMRFALPLAGSISDDIQFTGTLHRARTLFGSLVDDIQTRGEMRLATTMSSLVVDDYEISGYTRLATVLSSGNIVDDIQVEPSGLDKALVLGAQPIEDDHQISSDAVLALRLFASLVDDIQVDPTEMRMAYLLSATLDFDLDFLVRLHIPIPLRGSVQPDVLLQATYTPARFLYSVIEIDAQLSARLKTLAPGQTHAVEIVDDVQIRAAMRVAQALSASVVFDDFRLRSPGFSLADPIGPGRVIWDQQIRARLWLVNPLPLQATIEPDVQIVARDQRTRFKLRRIFISASIEVDVQIGAGMVAMPSQYVKPNDQIAYHDFQVGQVVTISGMGAPYDGTYIIASVTDTSFTVVRAGVAGAEPFVPPYGSTVTPVEQPPLVITDATVINGVATITTSTSTSSYVVGQTIQISGLGYPFDGSWVVTGVTGNTLTYARPGVPDTYAHTEPTTNIVSGSVTDGVVTLELGENHGYVPGQIIYVNGLGYPYDGRYVVTSVTGTTVSYSRPNVPDSTLVVPPSEPVPVTTTVPAQPDSSWVIPPPGSPWVPPGTDPPQGTPTITVVENADGTTTTTWTYPNGTVVSNTPQPDGSITVVYTPPPPTTGYIPPGGTYVHPPSGATEPQIIVGVEVSGNGDITLTTGVWVDLPPSGADHAEPPDGYEYKVPLSGARTRHSCPRPSLLPGAPGYTGPGINGSGGVGVSSIDAIIAIMQSSGIPHRVTSTYRPGDDGYHGSQNAVDFAGPVPGEDTPELARIAQFWKQFAAGLLELIHSGTAGPVYVKNGVFVGPYAVSIHHNHVHVAATLDGLQSSVTALPVQAPAPEEGTTFSSRMDGGNQAGSGETALKWHTNIYEYPKERLPW